MSSSPDAAAALRVTVLLPRHLDVAAWAQRHARGEVPDATPYGYHHALQQGCRLSFSRATPPWPGALGQLDRVLRKLLGFELRHVWANRALLRADRADVIWTHTEYEHLGVGLLRRLGLPTAPIVAQSIWLVDEWSRWSGVRRRLVRWLMRDAEAATFHSPLNMVRARELDLGERQVIVDFGISLDSYPIATERPQAELDGTRPLHVLALGNDRHRDWETLAQALGGRAGVELRIGSSHFPARLAQPNISAHPMTQAEVVANYGWADCVVVPLHENLHASGLTAVLEATARGVPVVATRAGGLDHYFDDDGIAFCTPHDAADLWRAVDALVTTPGRRAAQVAHAQQRLLSRRFSSEGFAQRHVELSRRLVGAGHEAAPVSATPLGTR
jgi:glycosyltransferase involved in cell wall biosynthesis